MTRPHLVIGRIAGIPVGLNASWFPVFLLVTWSLATGFLPHAAPGAGWLTLWATALAGSTLFFASILAHEFGHALVAQRLGIGVSSVTLFVLGGVSRIAEEPRTAWEELRIAAAGPLVSLAAALVFLVCALPLGRSPLLASVLIYLVLVNAALAIFNLLPALPLDGGRVLRAVLWAGLGSPGIATRWAAWSGRACGVLFAGIGVVALVLGALAPAFWMLLLGAFIERSAKSSVENMDPDIRMPIAAPALPLLLEEAMDEARYRKHEAKIIAWRARLDVLPRPGELGAAEGEGPDYREYQDARMRMYEILDNIERGLRARMTDPEIDSEFQRLSDLHAEWRPVATEDEGIPGAGEEASLAGRPERFAPDPEEALHREPGSSIEV